MLRRVVREYWPRPDPKARERHPEDASRQGIESRNPGMALQGSIPKGYCLPMQAGPLVTIVETRAFIASASALMDEEE
ncbi:hypothetical protein, partial [Pararhodospirillum oryzae]|uniref:hypothetical protein n=1 Tax=Pararhodospirillum oryzae TaxID=478448 RepID=UPI001C3FA8CA